MNRYLYLNQSISGEAQKQINATVNIQRQEAIIKNTQDWVLSVERFFLHGVRLPLFDTNGGECKVGVKIISTSVIQYDVVDFSAFADENGYIYNIEDVATAINNTLTSICTINSIAPIPTVIFDDKTLLFSVNSLDAFRNDNEVVFNETLRWYINSFYYTDADNDNEFFSIRLNGDIETQDTKTIEFLSPVSRIVIESYNMPVDYELLPPVSGGVSQNIGVFLTDFLYYQTNNQSLQSIVFNASETDHRYHNLKEDDNFKGFNLNFVWYDYNGEKHQLFLLPKSKAGVKLLFFNQKV